MSHLTFRNFTKAEKDALKRIAEAEGLSLAALMLRIIQGLASGDVVVPPKDSAAEKAVSIQLFLPDGKVGFKLKGAAKKAGRTSADLVRLAALREIKARLGNKAPGENGAGGPQGCAPASEEER